MKKKIIGVVVVISMLGALVGCTSSNKKVDEAITTETESGGKQETIYWIGKMYEGDAWISMNKGAALAGKELGINVICQTPEGGETDVAGEINLVENAINAGADGIVLGVSDADAMIDVCKKVKAAGIPLVLIDSGLNSEDYDAFVAFDNYKCGVLLAERIAKDIGNKGQVGIISAAVGSSTIASREKGFLDTIKKYPDIKIVGQIMYCNNDSATAMNQTYDMLNAYPDISAFMTTNSMSMEGVAAALTEKANGIKVYGSDSTDAIIGYLKSGIIGGFTVAAFPKMGYLSTVVCAKLVRGEDISTIEWNNETYKEDGKNFDAGVVLIDKDNYQDPKYEFNVHPFKFFDTYAGWDWKNNKSLGN